MTCDFPSHPIILNQRVMEPHDRLATLKISCLDMWSDILPILGCEVLLQAPFFEDTFVLSLAV